MCTAATYLKDNFYFGRNLDYDISFGESVTVMPRRFKLETCYHGVNDNHFAMIGMAHVENGYPLYYDAMNEKGLCIAGLNFVGNAVYSNCTGSRHKVAQFELIPWLLATCDSVRTARELLGSASITDTMFNKDMPAAQLHWIVADRDSCITVESVADGLHIYDNSVGVLTNNPPFPMQMAALNNYMQLSPKAPENRFSDKLNFDIYSRGMGAIGLPGDLSSQSRFVRAAFVKMNSASGNGEEECVNQFFHILGSVEQQRGCCITGSGKCEITQYTSCCNADKGIYYYTLYENRRICAVHMNRAELDSDKLSVYPLDSSPGINFIN